MIKTATQLRSPVFVDSRATPAAPSTGVRRLGETGNAVSRPQDSLILAIAQNRDRQAFIALYQHYAPRLKAYLIRQGGRDVAEEMAQEAMLTVWRKAELYDPAKASAGAWIYTIARNLFLDRRRKQKRAEVDLTDPLLVGEGPEIADSALSARQSELRVRAALAELPSDQAQVIALSFFEGKAHGAIAAELKLPLGTVKSRMRLALARLRGTLRELQ